MREVLYELCILQVFPGREFCNIEFTVGINDVGFWPGAAKRRSGVYKLIQPTSFKQFVTFFLHSNGISRIIEAYDTEEAAQEAARYAYFDLKECSDDDDPEHWDDDELTHYFDDDHVWGHESYEVQSVDYFGK